MSSELGFEQAREELANIVAALEVGGLSLEESLALWQRGEEVAAICTRWLDEARTKLHEAIATQQNSSDEA
ncbi:MAG: exodeoxyribonuclease VII small subunit [Candidatus Nanopelagicales bacterium]